MASITKGATNTSSTQNQNHNPNCHSPLAPESPLVQDAKGVGWSVIGVDNMCEAQYNSSGRAFGGWEQCHPIEQTRRRLFHSSPDAIRKASFYLCNLARFLR